MDPQLEEDKDAMLTDLNRSIKQVMMEVNLAGGGGNNSKLRQHSASILKLLKALESILFFGIKETSSILNSRGEVWLYLQKVEDCLPGAAGIVTQVRRSPRPQSNLGKGRFFLSMLICQKDLSSYLSSLMMNPELLKEHYGKYSLLRDDERNSTFLRLLETLSFFEIEKEERIPDFDDIDFFKKPMETSESNKIERTSSSSALPSPSSSSLINATPSLLLQKLRSAINDIDKEPQRVFYGNEPLSLNLLTVIHAICNHGLATKEGIFSSKKNTFWDFLEQYLEQCIPESRAIVLKARNEFDDSKERELCFLRSCLTRRCLSEYMNFLLHDRFISTMYEETALFRNIEHQNILFQMFRTLNKRAFSLEVPQQEDSWQTAVAVATSKPAQTELNTSGGIAGTRKKKVRKSRRLSKINTVAEEEQEKLVPIQQPLPVDILQFSQEIRSTSPEREELSIPEDEVFPSSSGPVTPRTSTSPTKETADSSFPFLTSSSSPTSSFSSVPTSLLSSSLAALPPPPTSTPSESLSSSTAAAPIEPPDRPLQDILAEIAAQLGMSESTDPPRLPTQQEQELDSQQHLDHLPPKSLSVLPFLSNNSPTDSLSLGRHSMGSLPRLVDSPAHQQLPSCASDIPSSTSNSTTSKKTSASEFSELSAGGEQSRAARNSSRSLSQIPDVLARGSDRGHQDLHILSSSITTMPKQRPPSLSVPRVSASFNPSSFYDAVGSGSVPVEIRSSRGLEERSEGVFTFINSYDSDIKSSFVNGNIAYPAPAGLSAIPPDSSYSASPPVHFHPAMSPTSHLSHSFHERGGGGNMRSGNDYGLLSENVSPASFHVSASYNGGGGMSNMALAPPLSSSVSSVSSYRSATVTSSTPSERRTTEARNRAYRNTEFLPRTDNLVSWDSSSSSSLSSYSSSQATMSPTRSSSTFDLLSRLSPFTSRPPPGLSSRKVYTSPDEPPLVVGSDRLLTDFVIEDYEQKQEEEMEASTLQRNPQAEVWDGKIRSVEDINAQHRNDSDQNLSSRENSRQSSDIDLDDELVINSYPKTKLVPGMRCGGCGSHLEIESFAVGLLEMFSSNRFCEYTGKWYCTRCHSGKTCIIPARVVNYWNFSTYPVCNSALKTIQRLASKPIVKIPDSPISSKILEKLARIKVYRSQLEYMRGYIETCRDRDSLIPKIKNKIYLFENNDVYSLHDLITVSEGNLEIFLLDCINRFRNHIYQCMICQLKGHICEGCNSRKPIFPFDVDIVTKCRKCKALYHIQCFSKASSCPRCKRIQDLKLAKARREAAYLPAHQSFNIPSSSPDFLEFANITKKKVFSEY